MIFRAALSHRFLLLLLSSPASPPMAVRSVCRTGLQLQCIRPAAARRQPRASDVAVIPHPPACAAGLRAGKNVRSILPVRHRAHPSRHPPSALVSAPAGHYPCTADRPAGCAARHPRQSTASLSPSILAPFGGSGSGIQCVTAQSTGLLYTSSGVKCRASHQPSGIK